MYRHTPSLHDALPISPFEHYEPARIVMATDCGMVRHDVDVHAHAVFAQRSDRATQSVLAAEFRADVVMIDDVIAVHRAAACGQERREVNVADAERGEIRNLCTGCVEAEEIGRAHV